MGVSDLPSPPLNVGADHQLPAPSPSERSETRTRLFQFAKITSTRVAGHWRRRRELRIFFPSISHLNLEIVSKRFKLDLNRRVSLLPRARRKARAQQAHLTGTGAATPVLPLGNCHLAEPPSRQEAINQQH
jgi:hypothetical protein